MDRVGLDVLEIAKVEVAFISSFRKRKPAKCCSSDHSHLVLIQLSLSPTVTIILISSLVPTTLLCVCKFATMNYHAIRFSFSQKDKAKDDPAALHLLFSSLLYYIRNTHPSLTLKNLFKCWIVLGIAPPCILL